MTEIILRLSLFSTGIFEGIGQGAHLRVADIWRSVVPGIPQKGWRATALQRRRHSSVTSRLIWRAAALCRFSPSIQCGAGNSEMRPRSGANWNCPGGYLGSAAHVLFRITARPSDV